MAYKLTKPQQKRRIVTRSQTSHCCKSQTAPSSWASPAQFWGKCNFFSRCHSFEFGVLENPSCIFSLFGFPTTPRYRISNYQSLKYQKYKTSSNHEASWAADDGTFCAIARSAAFPSNPWKWKGEDWGFRLQIFLFSSPHHPLSKIFLLFK